QDEAGIASAAGIAASMGDGLLEANRTGGTVKRVHCGWATPSAVASARPVPARAHRPADRAGGPLRVPAGVLRRPLPPGRRRPRPGPGLELPRVVFKPYACNHFTHAGVDAALRLRASGLAPADGTAIELGVAQPVL